MISFSRPRASHTWEMKSRKLMYGRVVARHRVLNVAPSVPGNRAMHVYSANESIPDPFSPAHIGLHIPKAP